MPRVTQITTKPLSLTQNGRLPVQDRVAPVDEHDTGIKLGVYGRGKTGKTRFICNFPKPVLIIGTEDGTKSVKNIPGVDFIQIVEIGEVDPLIQLLKTGGSCWQQTLTSWKKVPRGTGAPYKSAGLDTAGGLQGLVIMEVKELKEVPIAKTWGMVHQKEWGTIGLQTNAWLKKLLDLADTNNFNIGIIAHERNLSDPTTDSEIIAPSIGPALTPMSAGWLNGACDYICQTFIRDASEDREIIIGNQKQKQKIKTGKKEYCLRVGPHTIYQTGFRLPEGQAFETVGGTLPDIIVNPDFAKLKLLIEGKLKK